MKASPLSNSRSFVDKIDVVNQHYAYRFGFADQFYGVCSTIKDFSMFGMAVTTKSVKKRNGSSHIKVSMKEEMVPLQSYDSEESWYKQVIEDNCTREAYWCVAKKLYSPISNVLAIPATGVPIDRDEDTGEWAVMPQDYEEDVELPEREADKAIRQETPEPQDTTAVTPTKTTARSVDSQPQEERSKTRVVTKQIARDLDTDSDNDDDDDDDDEDDNDDENDYDDDEEGQEREKIPEALRRRANRPAPKMTELRNLGEDS